MSAAAKNLEAIDAAIKQHNGRCDFPPTAILMNPFEVERLGWDEYRGIPIRPDDKLGTGRFRITCDRPPPGAPPEIEKEKEIPAPGELVPT